MLNITSRILSFCITQYLSPSLEGTCVSDAAPLPPLPYPPLRWWYHCIVRLSVHLFSSQLSNFPAVSLKQYICQFFLLLFISTYTSEYFYSLTGMYKFTHLLLFADMLTDSTVGNLSNGLSGKFTLPSKKNKKTKKE